ncbi:hypothetical protein B7P33_10405 [Sediminicola luteus]|uniref:Deoxyribose-phosphate aldolase n=2 Tax=Sediminicola luteus TaxID=319238 RepID=A0A2A4G7G2_9FLAO|nr:hypothetical protein B7P33_10405 [Sediminicola luteus]
MLLRYSVVLLFVLAFTSCKEKPNAPNAQEIVDKAIKACGGDGYTSNRFDFEFRDRQYGLSRDTHGRKIMTRSWKENDSTLVLDSLYRSKMNRHINGKPEVLADSMAFKYANSINSVHYFAYLPYGLNDAAVHKSYLGSSQIKGKEYHKIKITFSPENGGKDFEDTFVYWINQESYYVDYLAYDYITDGGGVRFRVAYNERMVNGVRFVDYENYKPKDKATAKVATMDSLYLNQGLELLSKIALEKVTVSPLP